MDQENEKDGKMKKSGHFRVTRLRILGLFIGAGLVAVALGGFLVVSLSPATGANGADFLRKIIGDQPVAVMETTLLQAQDLVKKTEYTLGLSRTDNPFGPSVPAGPVSNPVAQVPPKKSGGPAAIAEASMGNPAVNPSGGNAPSPIVLANNGSPANGWMPPAVDARGSIPGSGQWQPYLTDSTGRVLAFRTLVLPDPSRPYAYAAIVAFDLQNTRLHYVIGFSQPYAPGVRKTSHGAIARADEQPGVLLAAFNGGFKYEHGHFGSMAGGLVSVPPVNGLGTLAIYTDGHIQIGAWNKDIFPSDSLVAYRQNGPLLIQNVKIGQRVDDSLIWGRTISGGVVTWRSGVAISADNRTLYYVAGPSLSADTLAAAMQTVHPQSGIQLDINSYWVHFIATRNENGQIKSEALFPKAMRADIDRYLGPYGRDFFYVTARP